MFEKIGRLAEGLALNVGTSRRGFLDRVGKSALGVAAALGVLGVAASAQSGGVVCCNYNCGRIYGGSPGKQTICLPAGSTCSRTVSWGYSSCYLKRVSTPSVCSKC